MNSQQLQEFGNSAADTRAAECPFVLHTRIVNGVGGGPEKTILNSPRFLKDLGYRSACLYLYPGDDPGFDVVTQRAMRAARN